MPVKVGNAALSWTEQGTGPVVLLLHSLGGAGSMWATTIAAIAGHRVLTLDARGHGGSDAAGEISVEQYGADGLALLDEIGAASAVVVGLSMGGQAAMHMALNAPDRVRGLFLADTSLGGRGNGAERMAQTRARIAEIGPAAFAEEYTRSRLMPTTSEESVGAFAGLVEKTLPDIYVRQTGSIASQDFRVTAVAIKTPTLVLVGSHDTSTPPPVGEQLCKAIAGAELTIIDQANHLSNLDQPDAFNAAVTDFLSRLTASDARICRGGPFRGKRQD